MDEKASTPDEKAAAAAARDIMANVTGGQDWRDYDEQYVMIRVLRAIGEATKADPLEHRRALRGPASSAR
jgi:hypothetical protein